MSTAFPSLLTKSVRREEGIGAISMKKHGLCLCLILCLSLWNAPNGYTRSLPDASSLQQALEQLEQTYSAELVLGTPLEVNGVKLIPLATVGFGSGEHALSPDSGKSEGMGGVVIPTGVIVVSGSNIRILHFRKVSLNNLSTPWRQSCFNDLHERL